MCLSLSYLCTFIFYLCLALVPGETHQIDASGLAAVPRAVARLDMSFNRQLNSEAMIALQGMPLIEVCDVKKLAYWFESVF